MRGVDGIVSECVYVCMHVFIMGTHMHICSPVYGGQRSMLGGREGWKKGKEEGKNEGRVGGSKEERT